MSRQPDNALLQRLHQRALQEGRSVDDLLARLLDDYDTTERNHAAVLDAVHDAVIATDTNLVITTWNRAAEAIYGWMAAEATGQVLDDLLQTAWPEQAQHDAQAVLWQTGHWEGEVQQTTKTGQPVVIWAAVSWLRDETGAIIGGVTVNRDITARKQMEAALRSSEEKFRLIAEQTSDGLLIIDGSTETVLYASPSYDRQRGRTIGASAGLTGEDLYDMVHPDDRDDVFARVYAAIANKAETLIYTYRSRHHDGHYLWKEDHTTFVYAPDGTYLRAYVVSRDITERKRAEAELRTSEEQFRLLFDSMAQGVVYQRADGAIIRANRAAEQILGLSLAQMMGRTSVDPRWRAIKADGTDFPGEEHPAMLALRTGNPVADVVMGVFHPQYNAYRWINVNAVPQFRPGETTPYQVYATFSDITERKRAEERLRSLLEMQTAYVVRTDIEGNFTYVNATWMEQFSWMREDFIGTFALETIVPEDHAKVTEVVMQCLLNPGQSYQLTIRKPTPHGDPLWTLWEFVALEDVFGISGNLEIQCIGLDITRRIQAEAAVRERDELFRLAFHSSPDSINLNRVADGLYLDVNDGFCTIMGYTREEVVGKTSLELNIWADAADRARLVAGLRQQGVVNDLEAEFRHKDGRIVLGLMTARILEYAGEQVILSVTRDITEQRRSEQLRLEHKTLKARVKQEQEQNAFIQQVMSALDHDLRTPLTAIANAKFLLNRHYSRLSEAKRQAEFDRISSQLQYAQSLLDDTIQVVKTILRGLRPAPVNLALLCQVNIDEVASVYNTDHHLIFANPGEVETAAVDEVLVSRILLNLLSNAIKYSPAGGDIRLELDQAADRVILRVIDQGIGIAAEDLPHIFEPFYRADEAQAIQGMGLGLRIVEDCVQRHQGRISVTSEPGRGSAFTVELPVDLPVTES